MFKDEKTLEELRKITPKLSGISYCIVTRDGDNIKIHCRENQPCIGGEHRKYNKTHPGDCTRPNDPRPGDLSDPFPKGTPVALSYNRQVFKEAKELVQFVLSDESPWVRGFRGEKYIEFIPPKHKTLAYSGWILKTGKIDPTVWINCLKFLQNASYIAFNDLIAKGMTKKEAVTCMALMSINKIPANKEYISPPSPYTMSIASSVNRVFTGQSRDLTGGTLSDRYDYNRPEMACVFTDEDQKTVPFVKQLSDKLPFEFSPEKFISVAKEIIHKNVD